MNEYTSYPATRVVETSNNGWGPLLASVIGGVVGYVVGRSNNACANGCANACSANGGCQTCFQQGEYTGENRAGINYIAQTANAALKAVGDLGDRIDQRAIAEKDARIQALENRLLIQEASGVTHCQLGQINRTLDSVTTGCGFKSYPGGNCF